VITPAHIQQAGQIAINWLKKIFQSILAVGELPTTWQETKVVFIPLAGKATHTTAKDFRPIILTSFLLKSFERTISLHIRATVDPTQISEAQHAYTKGKSTESALHSRRLATAEESGRVLCELREKCMKVDKLMQTKHKN